MFGREGVVEQVGDEAEGGLGDDLDDLIVGKPSSADGLEIGVFGVAARLGPLWWNASA